MISKESILAKTHYGTGIYAHILRQFYPGETVMKIVGRDCGICRNPFADGSETLHVWTEKINPEQKLSDEIARHKDQFDAIPEGERNINWVSKYGSFRSVCLSSSRS